MSTFNPDCSRCPRIAAYLEQIRQRFPEYHARPVPAFGAASPALLVVGLAPGLHGANATGRPFTGDYAGIMLYETLYKYGFSNQALATHKQDGLRLQNCRITNAVKCLPPENKPNGGEINICNDFLREEIAELDEPLIMLALGRIAHHAVLKACGLKQKDFEFGHGRCHRFTSDKWLVDSYHCSRYNTQTRRLTERMFHDVFDKIIDLQRRLHS